MTTARENNSSARARSVFVGACALGIALLVLATTVAIPRVLCRLMDLGVKEFPLPTQVVQSVSYAITSWWYLFVPVLASFALLLGIMASGQCPLPSRGWRIAVVGVIVGAIVFALFSLALPVVTVVNSLKG